MSSDDKGIFLQVSGLGKQYPHGAAPLQALRGFTLDMAAGEVVSIVGPSGCGKTTLLRITAGLIPPSEGSIVVGGAPPMDFLRDRGIGFVFQKPILFPWRTVAENLLLATEVRNGKTTEADRSRAAELLAIMGLRGFEHAYPRQLSGGMLQRAAMARAMMIQPQLLLLDEPFSALDDMTREQLWIDFSPFWTQQDLDVLLVTHSIREAVFFGDRLLVMSPRPGRVHATFDVPFSQPRDHAVLVRSEFTEFCEEVRGTLS